MRTRVANPERALVHRASATLPQPHRICSSHEPHAHSFILLRTGRASSIDGTSIAFSEWGSAAGPPVLRFVRNCTNSPFCVADDELFLSAAMSVPAVAREGASAWHVDYGSFFDEWELPVLVTHGGGDSLTPPAAAEKIARRLRAQLSIYPGCGHMPFWEESARFNRELAEFAEQTLSLGG